MPVGGEAQLIGSLADELAHAIVFAFSNGLVCITTANASGIERFEYAAAANVASSRSPTAAANELNIAVSMSVSSGAVRSERRRYAKGMGICLG